MNRPSLSHFHRENLLRGCGDLPRRDQQPGRVNDYLALWDQQPIAARAIPDAHDAVAGVFRNNFIDKVCRDADILGELVIGHLNPPVPTKGESTPAQKIGIRFIFSKMNEAQERSAARVGVVAALNVARHSEPQGAGS